MTYAELKRKLELMTDDRLNTDVTIFLSNQDEFLPINFLESITSKRFDDCSDVFDAEQVVLVTKE
jgi:hypothetical protein